MRAIFVALSALIGVSACSLGSVSNPFGSIGSGPFGRAAPPPQSAAVPDLGALPLLASIEAAESAPTRRGAIIRATGIAAGAGYYNARLVPAPGASPEDSVLDLVFLADPPARPQPGRTVGSRRIIAAFYLDESDLPGVRTIRIRSAGNIVSVRR